MPKLKSETLAERKTHILKAALVCFADRGYHQTTMDDVAREAGISKGGLYVHFQSKKMLFLALYDWFIGEFNFFSPAFPQGSTADEKLSSIIDEMIVTVSSDNFREVSSLMTDVWAQNSHDREINELVKKLYAQVRQPLIELIDGGIDEGTFVNIDANAFANILIAVYEGLLIQAMIDESAVDWDAVQNSLKMMIAGLRIESLA